ncbi:ribonuclease H-like domain-containing protein [Tanacetum coccineum]
MEQAVEQHILESKMFEVKMNQVLNENERLLEQVISKDIVNIIVNSSVNNAYVNVHECEKCLKLETVLLNKKDFIEKEIYDKLFRSYTTLEKHRISLEVDTQFNQEIFQRDNSVSNQSAKNFDQYFELNELKARSQEKDTVIRKLKEKIKSLSGNMNEDKVKKDIENIETINIELKHRVSKLIAENEHLKHTNMQLYDSIKPTRIRSKEQCDALVNKVNQKSMEISDLNVSLSPVIPTSQLHAAPPQPIYLAHYAGVPTQNQVFQHLPYGSARVLHYGAPTVFPQAFHTMTSQDPSWNIDIRASSHLVGNTCKHAKLLFYNSEYSVGSVSFFALCLGLPFAKKSDLFDNFVAFRAYVNKQFNVDIKALQCYHGGEYDNTYFHDLFRQNGIQFWFSCPRTSQQNGKSELMLRTINNLICTLLFQAHIPPSYLVEALNMAAHLLNILPFTAINNEIPFTKLYNQTSTYEHLRIFGCLCYPYVDVSHKLEPRSTPCIFVGYPANHRGYRCLELVSNKIIISRHVRFDEDAFLFGNVMSSNKPTYDFLLPPIQNTTNVSTTEPFVQHMDEPNNPITPRPTTPPTTLPQPNTPPSHSSTPIPPQPDTHPS